MDLDDLEAFLAVVRNDGFRRAAETLFISQSSLTRKVARLEQTLKAELLVRSPRGIEVTPQGQALVARAGRLLAAVQETRAVVSGQWSDSIVLGCTVTSAGSYLTDFLAAWIPAHPDIRVTMVEGEPLQTRRRLINHECDAAIVAAPLDRGVDSLPLARARVHALLPPGHRLAGSTAELPVEELHGEAVLTNGAEYLSNQLLHSACRVAGVRPEIAFQCSIGQTLVALVQAGLGIAVLSEAVQHDNRALVTRPLCDANGQPLAFDLDIAWPQDRPGTPAMRRFARDLSDFTAPMRAA